VRGRCLGGTGGEKTPVAVDNVHVRRTNSGSTGRRFGAPTLREKGWEAPIEHPQACCGEGAAGEGLQRRINGMVVRNDSKMAAAAGPARVARERRRVMVG
jgi:hypothetical protein